MPRNVQRCTPRAIPVNLYTELLRPLLFTLDAESVHHLAMNALRAGAPLLRAIPRRPDPRLARTVFGVRFRIPSASPPASTRTPTTCSRGRRSASALRKSGTITARAQPGNPRPRVFRYPRQRALINRMGFNNDGADAIASRLQRVRRRAGRASPSGSISANRR